MFDFGFSEMMIVGVVALIVLGPERLPLVARKTGEWIGKAQRFVAQVKSDIDRETELSELKRIQDEAKNLANDVKSSVEAQASSIESSVKSVADEANEAGKAAETAFNEVKSNAAGTPAEANSGVASAKDINEVYGWGDANTDSEIMTPAYAWNEPKTFAAAPRTRHARNDAWRRGRTAHWDGSPREEPPYPYLSIRESVRNDRSEAGA